MTTFPAEVATYVGRIRWFDRSDWAVYVGWVGSVSYTHLTLPTSDLV